MDQPHSTSFNFYKRGKEQGRTVFNINIPATNHFHTMHDMPDLETLALLICMYSILDMASAGSVSQYLSSVNGPIHGLSTTQITRKV